MSKRATKLFAVAMWIGVGQAHAETPTSLASGAPACGNVQGKGARPTGCDRVVDAARQRLRHAREAEQQALAAFVGQPRRLASGAPACGNVLTKAPPPPCTAERADALFEQRLAALTRAVAEVTAANQALREAEARRARDLVRT